MAAEEIQVSVFEEQVADPAPVNPTMEKKPTKPRKPRSPATHPPYIKMIQEAITSLKERTGSSQYAITNFIDEKHKDHIPPNFKKLLLFHLRKLTAAGKLIKVKNSYKIPAAAAKKTKAKATSKPKPKVSVAKPKAKSLVKQKSVAVVKPKTKPAFSAKHETKLADTKPKTKSFGKLKPVAKVAEAENCDCTSGQGSENFGERCTGEEEDSSGGKEGGGGEEGAGGEGIGEGEEG